MSVPPAPGRPPLVSPSAAAPRLVCPACGAERDTAECACGHHFARRGAVLVAGADDYAPPGFRHERREHLAELEDRHFWFAPRERLLARCLARLARGGAAAAVELGCGSGRLLPVLARHADRVVAVEGHAASAERAAARGSGAFVIHGDVTATPLAGGQFDLVAAFDVLEHVPAPAFLGEARRLARPDGRLLLAVPASDLLWSAADERAGHRCRYTARRLAAELRAAGWTPRGHTHYQALVFPLMVLSRRIAPRRLAVAERRPPRWLGRLLGTVNHAEVSLSRLLPMPFGSTLVAWAER